MDSKHKIVTFKVNIIIIVFYLDYCNLTKYLIIFQNLVIHKTRHTFKKTLVICDGEMSQDLE